MPNTRDLQLAGYRLTTAAIIYHMPDHPGLLQSLIWQHMDLAPEFPVLRRFLSFWEREIEAKLHSVNVARTEILPPPPFASASGLFELH